MIRMHIKVQGLAEALAKTKRMSTGMNKVIYDASGQWAQDTHRRRLAGPANYAPRRPKQTYVRTNTLGRNWRWRRFGGVGNVKVSFTNNTPYTIFVVGDARGQGQAWMHRGRWWKFSMRVSDALPRLRGMVLDRTRRLWKRG